MYSALAPTYIFYHRLQRTCSLYLHYAGYDSYHLPLPHLDSVYQQLRGWNASPPAWAIQPRFAWANLMIFSCRATFADTSHHRIPHRLHYHLRYHRGYGSKYCSRAAARWRRYSYRGIIAPSLPAAPTPADMLPLPFSSLASMPSSLLPSPHPTGITASNIIAPLQLLASIAVSSMPRSRHIAIYARRALPWLRLDSSPH